ncbi:MAG: DUF262 domain-containing protein [Hyphomicrobiaceae bacterium]
MLQDVETMSYIRVAVRTIEEHFSGDTIFHLPWFQRAYAWGEENAVRLLHDIVDASDGARGRYFLGQLLLAAREQDLKAALIDGHQRTLTLTIIIALLRDRIRDFGMRERLDRLIRHETPADGGWHQSYKVNPQSNTVECFAEFVQEPGATLIEPESNLHDFLESERNFLNNRNHLARALDDLAETEQAKIELAEFLLTRCSLVVQMVDDEEEAWEMLSIEETTGLAFHSSERSKVALITVMRRDLQHDAGNLWDIWQARLGANGMARLLRHIRALRHNRRSSKPIEQDLIELYELRDADLTFMTDVLIPQAERYSALMNKAIGNGETTARISQSIEYMQWLGRELWVPPALRWIEVRGSNDPDAAEFFALLERLAWLMRIASRDPVEQERRFLRVAGKIDSGAAVADMEDLLVDQKLYEAAVESLTSRTFYDKSYSRLVLRRLSVLLGSDCGAIDGDNATVEHVLPRRPAQRSAWYESFRNKKTIDVHAHRLGNLAVLSFDQNQLAGSSDFAIKQQILRSSKFILSQRAAQYRDWTPGVIVERTNELANTLFAAWRLQFPAS